MEVIRKKILQAVITGTTSGCTGNCRIIIPDLTAIYHLKICLTQDTHDAAIFDIYPEPVYNSNTMPIGIGNLI